MDFVFAIGDKRQMRQIRPMLQFHYAEDLPVLSTSRAWNGQLSNTESFDLGGIALPEMPWILDTEEASPLSRSNLQHNLLQGERKYLRLLPMGIDAYQVLPQLGKLQSSSLLPHKGKTGLLYLDKRRQLRRRMTWVSLQQQPRILGITPPVDTVQVLPPEEILPDTDESPAPAQR
jgi:outer membrane PBP1 activator LpoA protein